MTARSLLLGLALTLVITAPPMAVAAPITVDFSTITPPNGTNLNTANFTFGGITIGAFYNSGGGYVQTGATLFARNEPPLDLGMGVCGPSQQSSIACDNALYSSGGGDINELDNAVVPELIRLTLPAGFSWISVSISSLDCNGSAGCSDPETGQLWFSNVDNLGTGGLGTKYTDYAATSDVNVSLDIALLGPAAFAQFLYFIPTGGANNDHLVWRATIEEGGGGIIEVPAPSALLLTGLGLLLTVGAAKARRRPGSRPAAR